MWAAPESPRGISLGVAEDIDWLTPTRSGGRSQDQQDTVHDQLPVIWGSCVGLSLNKCQKRSFSLPQMTMWCGC